MLKIVQVKFGESVKAVSCKVADFEINPGELVIVDSGRGLEYGEVFSGRELVLEDKLEENPNKIIRRATEEDLKQIEENRLKAKEAIEVCSKKIAELKLPMKLVSGEYSFDLSRLTFYFTAEERIDFRNLFKELAALFPARIEIKQIGVRDEAKRLGGLGPCGQTLCCSRFLKNFEPVSMKMARDQGLPLNPAKISGTCGRLMCCLDYEYPFYKEARKGLPPPGQLVRTKDGQEGKIVGYNFLKGAFLIELGGGQIEVLYNEVALVNQKKNG